MPQYCSDDPLATRRGLDGAIMESGNQITRHLGKRAVHQARQTGGGKEKKVRGPLRGRCRAFIDAMDVLRRHVNSLKAA